MSRSTDSMVAFHIDAKVNVQTLATWTPERIAAFFDGVSRVLAANGDVAAPVHPDCDLLTLPDDVRDVWETFKLVVLRHKAEAWSEISKDGMIGALWTLIRLAEVRP